MQTNSIITIIAAIAVTGIIALGIYSFRKKNLSKPIEKKTMDKLTLFDIKEFFHKAPAPLINNCKPVVLKANKKLIKSLNILKQHPEYSYYVLTYYDTKIEMIQTEYTVVVETKSIDSNLSEAFGEKEMLILE